MRYIMITLSTVLTFINKEAFMNFDYAWSIISIFTTYHKQAFFDKYGKEINGVKYISLSNGILQKLDKKTDNFDSEIYKTELKLLNELQKFAQ